MEKTKTTSLKAPRPRLLINSTKKKKKSFLILCAENVLDFFRFVFVVVVVNTEDGCMGLVNVIVHYQAILNYIRRTRIRVSMICSELAYGSTSLSVDHISFFNHRFIGMKPRNVTQPCTHLPLMFPYIQK